MVTRFGMGGSLGPVSYETEPNGYLGALGARERLYAEETAREIDVAVRDIVDGQFQRARSILQKNRPLLEESARELLAKETLADGDLARVLERVRGEEPLIAAASRA
jgi:cell division protease FtsH